MPRMIKKKDVLSLNHHQHTPLSRKKGVRSCRKCGNGDGHGSICANTGSINNERTFKKGPWTAEEDALLIEYVRKHGERHWNCVQSTGLIRCGKSCRLRWTNHLRPDLKKGAFSSEEESIVLELHAKLGNKWSKIAAELPGRTDNEVKNFWNTKIKRRMKAAEALILNSGGNNQKHLGNFNHYPQYQNNPQANIYQELSISIPNSLYTSHSSLSALSTPTSFPMSYSLSQPNVLSNKDFNTINSTDIGDQILSFLNNPSYEFKLMLEDEASQCDANNFDVNFPMIPKIPMEHNPNIGIITSQTQPNISLEASNIVFNENLGDDVMFTSDRTQLPLHQMIHEEHLLVPSPSSVVSSTKERLKNVSTPQYTGINSKENKSLLIDKRKSSMDEIPFGTDREMTMIPLDNDMVNSRLLEEYNSNLFSIGMKKSNKAPHEEMMSMDDDLSSLLFDYSILGSPLL